MHLLTSAKAVALSIIIFQDLQGVTEVRKQLPLIASDAGDNWLVKGQFYNDPGLNAQFCITYVFLNKTNAEVVGIGSYLRTKLNAADETRLRKDIPEPRFTEIFGPPTVFVPGGPQLELYEVIKGGVINSRDAAVDYAFALMKADPSMAKIPKSALTAREEKGSWDITALTPEGERIKCLRFSRANGKVLSSAIK